MFVNRKITLFCLCCAVVCASFNANAENRKKVNAIAKKSEQSGLITNRLYMPPSIQPDDDIRVVVETDGMNYSHQDPLWRAFASKTKCILYHNISFEKNKKATLKKIAEMTGHPEVEFAYNVQAQSSGGAAILSQMNERTLAAMIHDSQWTLYRINVVMNSKRFAPANFPLFSTAGSHDANSQVVYDAAFQASKLGWLLTSANDMSAMHCNKTRAVTKLQLMWLEEIMKLRIPKRTSKKAFTPLKEINPSIGWLGKMRLTMLNGRNEYVEPQIFPYPKAPGNKKSYIWFPSEKVAKAWLNIIKYGNPEGARELAVIESDNMVANNLHRNTMRYLDEVNFHGKVVKSVAGSKYFTIGHNGNLAVNSPPFGAYTLKLTLKDDFGTATQFLRYRNVDTKNPQPKLSITAPAEGAKFKEGAVVRFTITASDDSTAPKKLLKSAEWVSNVDGLIGKGGKLEIKNLSPGFHTVSCSVFDESGQFNIATVDFTVLPSGKNYPPTIKKIKNVTTDEDTPAKNIKLVFEDKNNDRLIVTLQSDNPDLVDDSGFYLYGAGYERTLVIVPKQNAYGTAKIIVTAQDESLATSTSFKLIVNPIQDIPVTKPDLFEISPAAKSILLTPLNNDYDPDGDKLKITSVSSDNAVIVSKGEKIEFKRPNGNKQVYEFKIKVSDGKNAPVDESVIVVVSKRKRLVDLDFMTINSKVKNLGVLGPSSDATLCGYIKKTPGIIGKYALKTEGITCFNGGFLDVGTDPGLNFNMWRDSFSICVWFKTTKDKGVLVRRGPQIPKIFDVHVLSPHTSKRQNQGYDDFLGNIMDNPDFEIWIDKGILNAKMGSMVPGSTNIINGKTKIKPGVWHLAVLTNDAPAMITAQLYLDGILQGTNSSPNYVSENHRLILCGFATDDSPALNKIMPFFTGEIGGFIIFDKALKRQDIVNLAKLKPKF